MSYVVNWRGQDGQAGWHPVGDLSEAAAHVEHLRNIEGVTETKIFQLEEVAFEFRQYYRVELAPPTQAPVAFAAQIEPEPEPAPAPETPVLAEVVAAEDVPWAAEVAAVPEVGAELPDTDSVLAEVGASTDDGGANGSRRGLFGR